MHLHKMKIRCKVMTRGCTTRIEKHPPCAFDCLVTTVNTGSKMDSVFNSQRCSDRPAHDIKAPREQRESRRLHMVSRSFDITCLSCRVKSSTPVASE